MRFVQDKEGFLYPVTDSGEFLAGNPLEEGQEEDAWVAQVSSP
jgi:hypothetical protein